MEYTTLQDSFSEGGAQGKSYMDSEGQIYTFLGFQRETNPGNTSVRKMKVNRGGLEELVDIGSHLEDKRAVTQPEEDGLYESIKNGEFFFYSSGVFRDSSGNEVTPEDEKGFLPTPYSEEYINKLKGEANSLKIQAWELHEGGCKLDTLVKDIEACYNPQQKDQDNYAIEEISLDGLEDEVSLDSFGSGSGLLNLTLQSDDTSLGKILEEAYKPENLEDEMRIDGQPQLGRDITEYDTHSGEVSLSDSSIQPANIDLTDTHSGEISLENLEDEISLESFGSGSGLLNLSLETNDTSLGGILDEIYTEEETSDSGNTTAYAAQPPEDEPHSREPVRIEPAYNPKNILKRKSLIRRILGL